MSSAMDTNTSISVDGRSINRPADYVPNDGTRVTFKHKKILKTKKKTFQEYLSESRRNLITQWRGVTDFQDKVGVYALMPLSTTTFPYTIDTTEYQVSSLWMPVYAYNLSARSYGITQTTGVTAVVYKCPMMQLCRQTVMATDGLRQQFGVSWYTWLPVSGAYNCLTGGLAPVQTNLSAFNNTVSGPFRGPQYEQCYYFNEMIESIESDISTNDKYTHEWSDIKLAIKGGDAESGCVDVSIVRFNNDAAAPLRLYSQKPNTQWTDISTNDGTVPTNVLVPDMDNTPLRYPLNQFTPNPSGGWQTEVSNQNQSTYLCNPVATDDCNDVTAYWDTYFANMMGHPCIKDVNYSKSKQPWRTIKQFCVRTGGAAKDVLLDEALSANPNPPRGVEHIFYKSGRVFDTTLTEFEADAKNAIDGTTNEGNQNPSDPNSRLRGPNAQTLQYYSNRLNQNICCPSRKADDYLLIKGRWPYVEVPQTADNSIGGIEFEGLVPNRPVGGTLRTDFAPAPSIGGATTGYRPIPVFARYYQDYMESTRAKMFNSFDLSVRSKFSTGL